MKKLSFVSAFLLCGVFARAQSNVTANANGTLQSPSNFFTANGSAIASAAGAVTSLTGDATASGPGAASVTVAKVNGVSYGASPSTNTVPVVTGSNTVTYEAVPTAAGGVPAGGTTGQILVKNSGTGYDTGWSAASAAPTSTVGLSAVAGSASTFMRSDAAPAISQSISPTMTGNWQFNGKLGVNGLGTGSMGDPTVPTYFKRTSATSASVLLGADVEYIAPFYSDDIGIGLLVDLKNTSAADGSLTGGHLPALVARAQDTSSGKMAMYGVEGKIIRTGTLDRGSAVWAIADYSGSTFSGRSILAYDGFCEVYSNPKDILHSPVAEGTTVVYHASLPTGGDPGRMYSFFTDVPGAGAPGWQFFNAGPVIVSDSAGNGGNISLSHDGTDAHVVVSGGGALRLHAHGNYVVLQDGNGIVPLANGAALGVNSYAWNVTATSIADQGNLSVSGNLSTTGSLTVSGALSANGALSVNGALLTTLTTLSYGSTISLNPDLGNVYKTTTSAMTGGATINATIAGMAGQTISIIITNDATAGETITFGSNFKPTGTLVGTVGKTAVVNFVSDGTYFYESGRATGE